LVPVVRNELAPAPDFPRLPPEVSSDGFLASANDASEAPEPIASVEEHLQKLGATYYLLEHWGRDPQIYRFQCKIAIAGSPHFVRYFEGTDSDPLRAMDKVLAQVEAWQAR
jgi:hypothetical protein